MPSPDVIERFIIRVEENAHAEACEEFHLLDSTMTENQGAPRVGRHAHVAAEQAIMARAVSVTSQCIRPVFIHGDHVAIRWRFRFEWPNGTVTDMEEMAVQRWVGDKIASETFFYDPAQRVPKPQMS